MRSQFLLVKVSKPYLTAGQANPWKIWSGNETNLETDYETQVVTNAQACQFVGAMAYTSTTDNTYSYWPLYVYQLAPAFPVF